MEFDRRVQIRVRRAGTAARGFGSGYLIAPRLVLTADHVLEGVDPGGGPGSVTVRLPDGSEREFPATVRWRRLDGAVDAALLEVDEAADWQVPASLSDLLVRPPQRYGHLIGTRPHPVALTGFPRLQKDPADGRRLDEQVTGHIVPGTGELAGRYEVSGTVPAPAGPPAKGGSRWSGISGAAVLAEDGQGQDLLCGVVRRDRQAEGGTRLTATPVRSLLADEAFRTLVAEHTGWSPVLEPAEPVHLLTAATADRDLESPAALLRADAEAVTFHGRDAELADLRAWCEDDPATVAIRVLVGPGGQGKTRLARQLTDTLGRQGWAAGHLRADLTDHDTAPDLAPLTTGLPLLLVVDYAETRPRLLRQVLGHLHRSRHRVRLLLLARSDGEWRTDALSAVPPVRRLLVAAPVVPLAPLIPPGRPGGDRDVAFRRAAEDLARLLPRVPTVPAHDWSRLAVTLPLPEELGHARYDNALALQLAALVALLQQGPRPVEASSGASAEEILLEHEERFWADSADAPAFRLGLATPVLAAAVAVAALCGAASAESATRVLATLPGLPPDRAERTVTWLSRLYPADPDRYWGTLQPDRIAEYHVSRVLVRQGFVLTGLLAAGDSGQQAQAITVLARAAIAHYNSGRPAESDSVLAALDTAVESVPLSRRTLRAVNAALPYPSHVVAGLGLRLAGALARLSERLASADPAAHELDLAVDTSHWSSRLTEVGRHGEALAASERAVGLWRRLAAADPSTHEPDLAGTLANLGSQLSGVGRHSEALVVAEEAVGLWRRLAAASPNAHEHRLAMSLTNLGSHLEHVGRHGEALAAAAEAVGLWRRSAAVNQSGREMELAAALSNLGIRLAAVARYQDALAAESEAVEMRRRLVAANPAAQEVQLARSLSNLGARLSEVGRHGEALVAAEEAVGLWRRLASVHPAAHEPGLASSLSNLGNCLSRQGRQEEGLASLETAMALWRRLAQANPAAHEPELAAALSNLGVWRAKAGHTDGARAVSEEAVAIRRRLASANPAAHAPGLASSLANLSRRLSDLGEHDEAVAAAMEAVEVRRRLALIDPAACEPELAQDLAGLGRRLERSGRTRESLVAMEEAVGIWSRLASVGPIAYESEFAGALFSFGRVLSAVGRVGEGLEALGQATDLLGRLAREDPVAHESELAHVLVELGLQLLGAGRNAEALTALERSAELRQRLAAGDPASHEPELGRVLTVRAVAVARLGALAEALRDTDEALELCGRHPAALLQGLPLLPVVLSLRAELLDALGRPQEAETVRQRVARTSPVAGPRE